MVCRRVWYVKAESANSVYKALTAMQRTPCGHYGMADIGRIVDVEAEYEGKDGTVG